MKRISWTKTDTPSIMFTSLTTKNWGRTFAFCAVMKEDIDPSILRRAINDVLAEYPSARTDLKSGFFWSYQLILENEPEMRRASSRPLLPITSRQKGLPNLRFIYRGKSVSLEAAHCIGDGRGVMHIFEEILGRYIFLCDGGEGKYVPFDTPENTMENAFDTYYDKNGEKYVDEARPAFHFEERFDDDYIKLLFADVSKSKAKALAHSHSMTVTEYLCSVLILGVIRSETKPINMPITISVPVDLRRFFETKTLRNFVVEASVTFTPNGRTDFTIDEICDATQGSLKAELKRDNLQKHLNKFGSLKFNPILRAVPYFIKKPVLAALQKKGHKTSTTIFTNLGEMTPPDNLSERIEKLRFINGDTRKYGLPVTCSCVSIGDSLSLCFSCANGSTAWFDACVKILEDEGLVVNSEVFEGAEKCETPNLKRSEQTLNTFEALKAFFNI